MMFYDANRRGSRIAARILIALLIVAGGIGIAGRGQISSGELADIRTVIESAKSTRATAAASMDFAQGTMHANDFQSAITSTRQAVADYDQLAANASLTRFTSDSPFAQFVFTPRTTLLGTVDRLNNAANTMQTQTAALIDAMETSFANDFRTDGGHWMVQVDDPAAINELVSRYGKQRSYQTLQEHLDDLKSLYNLEQRVRQQVADSIAAVHAGETNAAQIAVPTEAGAMDAAGWLDTAQSVASTLGVQVKQTSVYGCPGADDNGDDNADMVIGFFCGGSQASRNEVNMLTTHPEWPAVESSPLLVDYTKHELAHRSIMIVCGTTEPEIAANRTEAVTNSYAVQFLGASRERIAGSQQGLAAYAMDAQSDQIAQSIHNGTCA